MPTYEYKNIETGEIYEFKQSMKDDALTHHPETGAAIKRIVSVPGIAFKGSGFYANDSRSGGSRGAQAESKAAPATSEGSTPAGSTEPAAAKAAAPTEKAAPVKSGE